MAKNRSRTKRAPGPRMTIRFTQPVILDRLVTLAKAADRKPSEYARNVLRDHVQKSQAAAAV